ncbi:hypothetical protein SAMN04488003_14210 [Loktanella fryxellensis]|uniref:Uncharacterized protein n=1 Tax=Loktanella fryxellensis TaxID=245187 RepID=A0A1H8JS17_9RHOB|nr:hypothetical protein [Loktanella fryxellensis]SEN83544.1 hypothetical protein SAMN04488003_14210 [Loktanella fryxellensis]
MTSMTNDTSPMTDADGTDTRPWYMMRSSILMICVTVVGLIGIAADQFGGDSAPTGNFRVMENGIIIHSRTIGAQTATD